ncbi:MAG: threonine synthase [Bacteroidetes bacterium]|nr:threonine synthase [Bacteroidota bacterium]
MRYFSTQRQSPLVGFREATINGQAPDKGLYFPESIPVLTGEFQKTFRNKSRPELAYEVIRPYVSGEIPDADLFTICEETVNFDFPLVRVNQDIWSLELYHGPTLAFKDVGARFMSRCLGYFSKGSNKHITILVATSGDTGSAVANGFLGVENVDVVILYPSGKVSKVQEKMLTTLGKNITALEVQGTFDDCQKMVKQAFLDNELNSKLSLTSANSINIARWIPQQFYYFFALQQWKEEALPVICVPSGNFGNICAGLLGNASGLQVQHFIAACNQNKVFTDYLDTSVYQPADAVETYSNAMDVGNPSNFVRLLELFENDFPAIRNLISSYSISDGETSDTISRVFKKDSYLLEPHGAVAYHALEMYLEKNPGKKGIMLETAHPVKFGDIVEKSIRKTIEIPESLRHLSELKKESILIKPEFLDLKEYLLSR